MWFVYFHKPWLSVHLSHLLIVRFLQGTVHRSCIRSFLSFFIVARKWWSRSEVDPPLSALLAFVHLHTSWYHTYALHWYLTHFLISHFTHYNDILHLLISRLHTSMISYISWYHAYTLQWYLISPDITLSRYTDILHTFWYHAIHTTLIFYISWYHTFTLHWYLTHFLIISTFQGFPSINF